MGVAGFGVTFNRTGQHGTAPDHTGPVLGCDYSPHRAAPGNTVPHRTHTGPHRARTETEMTDYFTSTTVTSRIKA